MIKHLMTIILFVIIPVFLFAGFDINTDKDKHIMELFNKSKFEFNLDKKIDMYIKIVGEIKEEISRYKGEETIDYGEDGNLPKKYIDIESAIDELAYKLDEQIKYENGDKKNRKIYERIFKLAEGTFEIGPLFRDSFKEGQLSSAYIEVCSRDKDFKNGEEVLKRWFSGGEDLSGTGKLSYFDLGRYNASVYTVTKNGGIHILQIGESILYTYLKTYNIEGTNKKAVLILEEGGNGAGGSTAYLIGIQNEYPEIIFKTPGAAIEHTLFKDIDGDNEEELYGDAMLKYKRVFWPFCYKWNGTTFVDITLDHPEKLIEKR